MNRSLRNLALLGLLALGASTAGAQATPSPVLININYNAATRELTFTPTTNSPGLQLLSGTTNVPSGNGLLFENFFTSAPQTGASDTIPFSKITGQLTGYSSGSWTNPADSFDAPYSDGLPQGTGLMLLSFDMGTLKFSPSQQAFASGANNSLTIEFASNSNQPFATSSFTGTINVLGQNISTSPATSGSWDIGYYSYTYSAVPEPSTYAAIAGALGLAYAVYRRRRQAAAAAATA